MSLQLGLNVGISNADYHADKNFLSSSQLKILLKDHYEFRKLYTFGEKPKEETGDTSFFDFGTYVHTAILEPHLLDSTTIILPMPRISYKTYETYSRYSKDDRLMDRQSFLSAKSDYETFLIQNSHKVVISADEKEKINMLVDKTLKMPFFQLLLKNGRKESTYAANLKGVPVKCRWDLEGPGYGLDVKTTSFSTDPVSLQLTNLKREYGLSAGMYIEVSKEFVTPKIRDFYFLFINKVNYDILLVKQDEKFIKQGKAQFYEALAKYRHFSKLGFFDVESHSEIIERL